MELLFVVAAGLGVVFLLLGLLTGTDFAADLGSDAISMPVVGAFLAAGGVTGLVLTTGGSALPIALAAAAGVGAVASVPVSYVSRRLRRTEDSAAAITSAGFVGAFGEIVHPASMSNDGMADVIIDGERYRKRVRPAHETPDPLAVGSRVIVVDTDEDGTLLVDASPDWLAGRT